MRIADERCSFHRIESISRTHEGTGIGLSLALEIVKAHKGQLEVESLLNEGSTFRVRLKRGITHLPAAQIDMEPAEPISMRPSGHRDLSVVEQAETWKVEPSMEAAMGSSSSSSAPSSGEEAFLVGADLLNFKNSVVMLVDDNADLRSYLASILSKAVTVIQFPDGQSALEYAKKRPPDLVVSDMMMPHLDGRGLLAALRKNPGTALVPIIFISAQAGVEARAEALEEGADDYLVKPFQSREFLARVNVHLQLGRMRHELERRVEERTRALIESEARYRGLADQHATLSRVSPVGIFMADPRGNVTYANPRFYVITGHPTSKPLHEWRDSVLPEDLERAEQIWAQSLDPTLRKDADGTPMEFRWKRGNWAQFEMRALEEGRGFVGAVTDISHQKEVEHLHIEMLEGRAKEAEENRHQLELFIDFCSHELRNPLNGVLQNAQAVGGSLEHITEVLDDMRLGEVYRLCSCSAGLC